MTLNLSTRLLGRESGLTRPPYRVKGIYGDSTFVQNLDIVNELTGHTGCVNALSWARSGRFLATGSDDTLVNIYTYAPENSASQFTLNTSINTGHTRNIFSVKFMPHTNDSLIVSCAGDGQIRVFDIGHTSTSSSAHRMLFPNSTSGKVFQSHAGPVKRLVTEDSPFYFLSCAEDGDVRQWDIRQNDAYYPAPTPARLKKKLVPPPLISYASYNLNIYSISCSPSQPHYIALGGDHLHCFLHDRRMTGRDLLKERGASIPLSLDVEQTEEKLADATRCVAKFAPYGQPDMYKTESKYITACKLGHANPNELIVSWTGDHIYSFDILKSQLDAQNKVFLREPSQETSASSERKRKRLHTPGSPSNGPNLRTRTISQYQTSQTNPTRHDPPQNAGRVYASKIRTLKNNLARTHFSHDEMDREEEIEVILDSARSAFADINRYILAQKLSPDASAYDLKLAADRSKVWRYAQASGTLARILHRLSSRRSDLDVFDIIRPAPKESSAELERHEIFGYEFCKAILLWLESGVGAVIREFSPESRYFTSQTRSRFPIPRFAGVEALKTYLIPYLQSLAADLPVVYMGHGGAGDDPRETHDIFDTEKLAVQAFGQAMQIPFTDLQSSGNIPTSDTLRRTTDRLVAINFWGHKVCMAVFNSACLEITFAFAENAFSHRLDQDEALNQAPTSHQEPAAPKKLPTIITDLSSTGNAETGPSSRRSRNPTVIDLTKRSQEQDPSLETNRNDAAATRIEQDDQNDDEDIQNELDAVMALQNNYELVMNSDDEDEDDEEDEDEDEDEDDEEESLLEDDDRELEHESEEEDAEDDDSDDANPFMQLAAMDSRARSSRFKAGKGVPAYSHVRNYQGHCNIQTTKDVNFYGLQDEYVVSGSDCGNLFIWEKKSGRLVNILRGDEEVVNVIQPHPYEPMLAVSGIDSTIKIFSPDRLARRAAARAEGISAADPSTFSSIRSPYEAARASGSRRTSSRRESSTGDSQEVEANEEEEEIVVADRGLSSRKMMDGMHQIVSQNDMDRRQGVQSNYVSSSILMRLGQMGVLEENMTENCPMM